MKTNESIPEIAYEILKKSKKPIHYKDLTKKIMENKELKGNTPWKTVNACLSTNPKFKRIGEGRSGTYTLSEWD